MTIFECVILRTVQKSGLMTSSKALFFTTLFLAAFPAALFSQSAPKIQYVENKNQWPGDIDFGLRVSGGSMFVKPGGFSYYFLDQKKIG